MNAIRFDGVMPQLLGRQRVVAEDTVRRFLKAIDEYDVAGIAETD